MKKKVLSLRFVYIIINDQSFYVLMSTSKAHVIFIEKQKSFILENRLKSLRDYVTHVGLVDFLMLLQARMIPLLVPWNTLLKTQTN